MIQQPDASPVPVDFPRRGEGALAGVQPKLAVRLIAGKFISGETDEELLERYNACRDLVAQLIELATRKRTQHAELPLKEYLRRLAKGVANKGWDLDDRELGWVMLQVAVGLGGGPADAPGQEEVLVTFATNTAAASAPAPVPSVVDFALGQTRSLTKPE